MTNSKWLRGLGIDAFEDIIARKCYCCVASDGLECDGKCYENTMKWLKEEHHD